MAKTNAEIKYAVTLDEDQKKVKADIYANQIVIVSGRAGSGKSLVCANVALDMMFKKHDGISKIYVTRANVETGRSLGYLPGAQPFSSKILTPNGWITMGDVKEGDDVFASDGTVCKVLGVYDHGYRDVYEIETLQGKKTKACDKHLWEIRETNCRNKVNVPKLLNTKYLSENVSNRYGGYKLVLPCHKHVEFKPQDVNIHPYLVGVLLGDGCIKKNSAICFSNVDEDLIRRCKDIVESYNMLLTNKKGRIDYYISSTEENNKPSRKLEVIDVDTNVKKTYNRVGEFIKEFPEYSRGGIHYSNLHGTVYKDKLFTFIDNADISTNYVKNELNKIGLLGKGHLDKFVPDIFKYNSLEVRLEILKGLLDTDGGVKKNGNVYFTTTCVRLKDDVIELVRSLGGRATFFTRDRTKETTNKGINGRKIKSNYITYEVNISFEEYPELFHISRKKSRLLKHSNLHKDRIKSVTIVSNEPVRCIKIDHESELYITDDYIVTHNTLDEKFNPYLEAFKENVFKCYVDNAAKKDKIEEHFRKKDIDSMPIAFIRGKTMGDILIVEETQNLTPHEISSIVSRLGKTGRIVFNGDFDQCDTNMSYTGLHYLKDMSKAIPEIKWHTLKENHRSDLVGKILDWEHARKKAKVKISESIDE